MNETLLFAFVTTTLFFVATPGPSVAFATAQALRHGRRAAVVAVAGDALGTVVHIAVAASSLAFLIALSDVILPPLQIAGGLFILYMAHQSFASRKTASGAIAGASDRASFWAGFFACVSNPKAIVFFVALFPAFISPEHDILLQTIVYGVIFLVLDAASILAYALLTMRALERTTSRWLNASTLSGLGLAGVGVAMIVKGFRAAPID
ncbi:MAG: LysE family translocator [Pseudomonadota bacterium]